MNISEIDLLATRSDFSNDGFPDVDLSYEAATATIWAELRPEGSVRATSNFVSQLSSMQAHVSNFCATRSEIPVRFCVSMSRIPGVYNLGGDLPFFIDRVREQDEQALRSYAHACVEMIYGNCIGWGSPALTIALVQGDALGGGFESVISHNIVVAERGSKMGMPEILFNSFPGMGAFTFLTRKLDAMRAERMILSGKVYTAGEMFDMGLVDVLADDGKGVDEVRRIIGDERRYHILCAMRKVRQRISPVRIEEMHDITDIWVENVMKLHSSDLRKMERLVSAQGRRFASAKTQPFQ